MTSLMRIVVPSSTPFIRETTGTPAGIASPHWVRLSRRVCEGTASTTTSARSSASPVSTVARTLAGSSSSGR